ncbi:MAG: branched-chain amino acid transporter AzlD [Clostridiaceae bacterium]|jgi:branched-subunit amino acid transport protein AzlD|nr:AzlD domain-containing protein [Eubacteriales bacterium]NLB43953.1 branched-chain amino acid transporter AzlD [Clostridiaceae bacterium]
MTAWQTLAVVAVVAGLTFVTRALPFWLFRSPDRPSAWLSDLNRLMPPAVIAILVVFCLKTVSLDAPKDSLAQLIGVALVALLHVWKRNNLLSIGVGTVVYMLLVQVVWPV